MEYEIIYKKIKNLYLRVYPDHRIVVTAPFRTNKKDIEKFVTSKSEWIENKLKAPEIKQCSFNDDDILYVFGKAYNIRNVFSSLCYAELIDNNIFIYSDFSIENKKKAYYKLLKNELKPYITFVFSKYGKLIGKNAHSVKIRTMKSRWGSCNTKTFTITVNTSLAKYPLLCLELVCVHELCHLIEPSHNKNFKALVSKYYHEYNKVERILKDYLYDENNIRT